MRARPRSEEPASTTSAVPTGVVAITLLAALLHGVRDRSVGFGLNVVGIVLVDL